MQAYGSAALRLVVGGVLAAHGAQKLFGLWGGDGFAGTAALFGSIDPASSILVVLVGVVELIGGTMLLVGALTFYAAACLAVEMAVATWRVYTANGFFMNWSMASGQGHGSEFSLVLLGALVSLMLTGAGALSIDGRRARSAEAEAYGRARLRAGKV